MAAQQQAWVTFPIVVANYPKGDPIGTFYAFYSLLVYEIQAVYITLFLRNRDMLTFYCCSTHMLSEIMNYFLKNAIREPRPPSAIPGGGLFEGRYGMPSQHCHCFAYLSTMVLLLVFHYYGKYISSVKKLFTLVISVLALTLQVLGRIHLNFHTPEQCLVGVAFGAISAVAFYIICLRFFLPHSDYLCTLWILRVFSFRKDLVTPPPPPPPQLSRYEQKGIKRINRLNMKEH